MAGSSPLSKALLPSVATVAHSNGGSGVGLGGTGVAVGDGGAAAAGGGGSPPSDALNPSRNSAISDWMSGLIPTKTAATIAATIKRTIQARPPRPPRPRGRYRRGVRGGGPPDPGLTMSKVGLRGGSGRAGGGWRGAACGFGAAAASSSASSQAGRRGLAGREGGGWRLSVGGSLLDSHAGSSAGRPGRSGGGSLLERGVERL